MNAPEMRTLRCGMPLVIERITGVRSVGVCWLVSGGTAREPSEKQGLSAMWSELLFRGAGELDSRAHADALDRLGIARGGSPQSRYQRLSFTLLGDELEAALGLLVDMVRRPRMEERSIEPVRDLSLQALWGLRDDPQERVMLALRARHEAAPFNRSSYGTEEGLKGIGRSDLVQEWERAAKPESSVLAVAGDCDPAKVERRLNDLLEGWDGSCPEPQERGAAERGYEHISDQTNQAHIAIGIDAPKEADEASALERVAIGALSGGMSGRLFTEVREKRSLCYSVHARYRPTRDHGRVLAYAGTTPERAQETLDVLHGELRRLIGPEGGIDESEFRRAVTGLKSRIALGGESTSARAAALAGDQDAIGRPRSLEDLTARIEAVTLDQVNAYLRDRTLGEMTIVTIGPEPLKPPAGE